MLLAHFGTFCANKKPAESPPAGLFVSSRAKRAAPIYERGGHWMVVDSRPHIAQFRTFFAI